MRFTVTWTADAQNRLASLWIEHTDERKQIQQASDDIDRRLKHGAEQIASMAVQNTSMIRATPLCVIVEVEKEDCLLTVTHVFYEPEA